MKLRNILLTTDFSNAARDAYPAAVSLAKQLGAGLHLVHVAEPLPPFFFLQSRAVETDVPDDAYHEALGRRLDAEAGNEAFEDLPTTVRLLEHRHPYKALNDYARELEIGLVVVSTHGHTGIGYLLLGSFALNLVRHSDVAVLVYRETESPATYKPKRVLVPFDFSPCARAVLPWVRTLSAVYGSTFMFLHALEPAPPFVAAIDDFSEEFQRALDSAPQDTTSEFQALRHRELGGVSCEFELRSGVAYRQILEYAKESRPDLILMATHGRSALTDLLIGSVAEKVVRKATCPVMTVNTARQAARGSEVEA